MPELPEVEITKRGIKPYLKNQKITNTIVRNYQLRWKIDKNLNQLTLGKTVVDIKRRAKYLILTINTGSSIILHLGMSGRLAITSADIKAQKHDHIDFILSNGKILRYHDPRRFGACLWTEQPAEEHRLLKNLGIEPFDVELTSKTLYDLSRNKKKPIKSFIMDSKNIVGIGNIYASESLFYAGICPQKNCNDITKEQYANLAEKIKNVLLQAIAKGGTTLRDFLGSDGSLGYFSQELAVYGRTNEACLQCNSQIKQIKMQQRSTFYCPECQR